MALHLILGNSGAGKSHYLYEHILAEAAKHPKLTYYVIVPEQFTMATQREFVRRQKDHAILNVDVLSFKRLAYRVFEELGKNTLKVLEDTGKNLILQKLAGELEPKLTVLQGSLHKMGYIDEIKSFLTELAQYRIDPDMLDEMAQKASASPLLAAKLSDIRLLYEAFLKEIEGDYLLAEEVVEYMAALVPESALFSKAVLVFDGFTGFTPVQQTFLQAVLPVAADSYVALTIDAKEELYGECQVEQLFYLSKKTIRMLLRVAKETGVALADPVILSEGGRCRFAKAPLLYHLEQNLFRTGQTRYTGELKDQKQLRIVGFPKPVEELRFAAGEIRRLVREGYRYQDIAIVSGDVEMYASYVQQVFSEYEIPYFLDQTNPILFHPLIECVRGLLEMAKRDFTYDSVMRVLKSGLLPIETAQADLLENYVLAYGICGRSSWDRLWVRCPDWMDAEELAALNEKRGQLMEALDPFLDVMTDPEATVFLRTRALYDVMRAFHLEQGETDGRIWRILMDLFDKLAGLLGDEILSLEEYTDVLEAGMEAAKVAVIPPGFDQVLIGDIERTRLENVRVLFFLGVNDGVIPRISTEGGILSQLERQMLAEADYELAPTSRERAFIQRFYLYLNMTKPSERLYLTYAGCGADGASRRPSYLIGMIRRLFPGLEPEDGTVVSPMERMEAPGAALRYLTEGFDAAKRGEASEEWKALFAWYEKAPERKEQLSRLLSAAFYRFHQEPLSKEVSHLLYGSVLENSVTRLERFAACAYEHFLTYGLRLRPREEHTFEAVDFGNLVHTALEHYARGLAKSAYDWFSVPEEMQRALGREAMQMALDQSRNDALFTSAKNRYLTTRMEALLHQTVDTLTRQVRKGTFLPADYELGFGMAGSLDVTEFELSEDEKMRLRGRIDRVDTMDDGTDTYVKIIDYKSGQTTFSLLSMYHGLQLQLVVYLNAAMELLKKRPHTGDILPAGIFYYHVDEPVIETEGEVSEADIWQSVFEKLRLDGIVNDDPKVIRAMDESFTDRSDVIPVSRTKSGEWSKTSKVYSTERFHQISTYVNHVIEDLGKRMLAGEISVNPYELKGSTACTWCGFRSICGFDERMDGCRYRKLRQMRSEDEIFEAMERELSEEKTALDQEKEPHFGTPDDVQWKEVR
ncbi:MAG: exodeoxyribonuclease V subunit gamma [bacterium]|nr:exodeoxyribonuclease V subunit gamma [bacterium]MDY4098567.1 PD-(D/E)XK nuclease family protein [Lachnospiraceae bacterium]